VNLSKLAITRRRSRPRYTQHRYHYCIRIHPRDPSRLQSGSMKKSIKPSRDVSATSLTRRTQRERVCVVCLYDPWMAVKQHIGKFESDVARRLVYVPKQLRKLDGRCSQAPQFCFNVLAALPWTLFRHRSGGYPQR